MLNNRFFLISGYVLLVWWILDIVLKTAKYGATRLDFLWFCSIALLVLGLGIILKNPTFLNAVLAVAILVQPIWVLDYIWISFFGVPLNGISLFNFQPGFGLFEFINNFRHLFILPFAFYTVFMFSRKDRKSYFFITFSLLLVMTISYLLTPPQLNINCVNGPCVGDVGLTGFSYFTVFVFVIILLSLGINFIINLYCVIFW